MHVLIAPDGFPGLLTATQVAAAVAEGWRSTAPHDLLTCVPLSDGGPGFVEALATTVRGTTHAVVTTDPLGRQVPATILLAEGSAGPAAYLESAQAIGLHLLAPEERDPARTTSSGVGTLLTAALDLGARRIVVGVGGGGTNDAGAGLLAELGVGTPERLARGGLALADTTPTDLVGLDAARDRFRGVELLIAADVASPLLGLKGTSAVFAPAMGATQAEAQRLESALSHFASVVSRARPPATDLLSGEPIRPERGAGAGAGGGLGYALHLLGGRYVNGVEAVLDAVGFDGLTARSDLVVTVERAFDWESLGGTVVSDVATRVQDQGIPTILLTGHSVVSRREAMTAGLSGVYPVVDRADQSDLLNVHPGAALSLLAGRVARTWSSSHP